MSTQTSDPDRWMHLRHRDGFDDVHLNQFRAHCEVLRAYTNALLANWSVLFPGPGDCPEYHFGAPTRSADRLTVTLPIGGRSTLKSRSIIENSSSWMLWIRFPLSFREALEEGLTETVDPRIGPQTTWRQPSQFIVLGKTSPA